MSNYEISKSSLLSLKAEILRKQQELFKAKADNEVKIKIIKKNTPLEIKNKGIEARKQNDITEEEENLLKQSKSVLEAKSKLYDKLSSGKLTKEEIERNKRFLVRFDKKNKSEIRNPSPIDFEDAVPDKYSESEDDCYQSDEDEDGKDPGDKWVDYTDYLGRTRKCLKKDLEFLMSKDEELKKTVDVKRNDNLSSEEKFKDSLENNEKSSDVAKDSEGNIENENKITDESELLSNDMRRELLRRQWEKEEDELRNKSNIHYQDILFGEARTHGVGYYGFSKDEEERARQQEALKKLREETEAKQNRAQELKLIREKQMKARVKAAKDRRRARLGLPPEEEIEPEVPQPEILEEEKIKQEELKKKKEESEKLLEEARKKHLRPWDIGKEGVNVKVHYEMTQEEWVEQKRDERPHEFAPPEIYKSKEKDKREFRSTVIKSQLDDTDKSLLFTTKKQKNQKRGSKNVKGRLAQKNNVLTENEAPGVSEEMSDISGFNHSQVESTPIEDLCEQDFDDNLLMHYRKEMDNAEINDPYSDKIDNTNNWNRGRGVEIAPPTTFDYYGPSSSKRVKPSGTRINIQDSIEAGLKFLRKQVEENQKTSMNRYDYTSPS